MLCRPTTSKPSWTFCVRFDSGDWNSSAGLAPQLVIPAAVVHERAAGAVFGVEHLGDRDGVVAGIDHAMDAALEPGERAGDKRHAAVPRVPLDGAETVVPASREMFGERLLLLAQDVDA